MRSLSGLGVVVVFAAAAAAACGPVATNEVHPILDALPASATTTASVALPVEAPPLRPPGEKNTSLLPSHLTKELLAIGLDPAHLTPMKSLGMDQKKALMPLFAKSLGYAKPGDAGCSGCHVPGNFKAETRNRAIAREMYDRWSVELGVVVPGGENNAAGAPVFCDSCHANAALVLDRTDQKTVKAFMKSEYTDRLVRHKEGGTSCATCHGDDLEIDIFDKVWKVPPRASATSSKTPDPTLSTGSGAKTSPAPH